MKQTKLIILIFCLFIFANSCKVKEGFSPKLVAVKFIITDPQDQLITGARVYLFNNQQDLEKTIAFKSAFGAVDSTVSTNGNASIEVDPEKQYYVWIVYRDQTRRITFTNNNYSYILSDLRRNIDITVRVKLTAVDGTIGFWTKDTTSLPIEIVFDNETSNLTLPLPEAPASAFVPGIALYEKNEARLKYYAKNTKGCVWTGTVAVKKGEFTPVELVACDNGEVIFWTRNQNNNLLPIQIVINGNENIGDLSFSQDTPFACGDPITNVLQMYKEPGTYTYVASTSNGPCVWTGSFTVVKNQCTVVELKVCK